MTILRQPIQRLSPTPLDQHALLDRLRMTGVAGLSALAFVPGLVLLILTVLSIALSPLWVGFGLALVVVPASRALADAHRRLSGSVLGRPIDSAYAGTDEFGTLVRPIRWARDVHRWRDVGFLAFAATGGFVLSALPILLLVTPFAHVVLALVFRDWSAVVLLLVAALCPVLWWVLTPALVRSRAVAERSILGPTRAELAERVEQVEQTRAETLDHGAAEIRRIERDLHDGAQARIAAVGMNVGLAEQLVRNDPDTAEALLREARESTVGALEDLRSVVRGIRPPALVETGLDGALRALVVAMPLPVTLNLDVPALPEPVQSAVYFAISESLANTVKHSGATRAWVRAAHTQGVFTVEVGDDGRGGVDVAGSGIAGLRRRLAAFDGTMTVNSPPGGPTRLTLEVPCPRT